MWLWRAIEADIAMAGRTFAYTNPVTGTATTQAELATRIPEYVSRPLRVSTFITFLAVFEAFFADLVRAWLRAYPHAMADKGDVPVDVVLDAPDRDAILDFLIDRAVGGLFYKKPAEWFAFLEKRLKVPAPPADQLDRLAEAKATRDVLMHNRGVVNEVYVRKAGGRARHPAGELVDVPDPYHQETWELLMTVTADTSAVVLARVP